MIAEIIFNQRIEFCSTPNISPSEKNQVGKNNGDQFIVFKDKLKDFYHKIFIAEFKTPFSMPIDVTEDPSNIIEIFRGNTSSPTFSSNRARSIIQQIYL